MLSALIRTATSTEPLSAERPELTAHPERGQAANERQMPEERVKRWLDPGN